MLLYNRAINDTGTAISWVRPGCEPLGEMCLTISYKVTIALPRTLLLLLKHLCINIFAFKPHILLHASGMATASPTLSHS